MAFQSSDFDATLAAAAGADPSLAAELRGCFAESLRYQVDLLGRARCDGNWETSALRLRGLGASFNSSALIDLANEALDSAPGDPVVLRKLAAFADGFA